MSQTLDLEFEQNAEQVSPSVNTYINHHIQVITAIQDDEDLLSWTSNIFKNKASGTFLWAALVIEQLRDTDHWQVEDVLQEIPEGLGRIYDLILSQMDNLKAKVREACEVLLSFVAVVMRPLHLMELLVFINANQKASGHFKTSYQLRDIRDMAKSCGSILSIRNDIVYFVHQSAKDYILEAAAYRLFPIPRQHYTMFEASLDAMSGALKYDVYNLKNPEIYIGDILPRNSSADPLVTLKYCCVFWAEHLIKGFEHFEDTCQRLHSFLTEKFLC